MPKPTKKQTDPTDPLTDDFRNFLFVIWNHLGLPDPTPRQYAIGWYLQHGPKRKMVQAFRGVGKSWITAAYVLWRLYCNPQLNILVVSASKARAENFTTFCLQLIHDVPLLAHMKPRDGQRYSKSEFDVGPAEPDQNPSVRSAGITGQITGSRADEIIPDDIEIPGNSETQLMREKLAERIKEFESILKPEADSAISFLGTPQTEDSAYKKLPERGYDMRVWPALYPTEDERKGYEGKIAADILADLRKDPMLAGHSTEPTRFSDTELATRKVSIGKSTFALQFMLNTTLSDADRYPLKLHDLVVSPLDREQGPERYIWANTPDQLINDLPNVGMGGDRFYRPIALKDIAYLPYQGIAMSVDPAGRGKDETAYAIVAHLHGWLLLLDAGGFHNGSSNETLDSLARLARDFKVNKMVIEANFGDGMYTQLLKPKLYAYGHQLAVEEVKHSIQKEKRIIDTLEPVMNSHRLVIDSTLIKRDYESASAKDVEESERIRYSLLHQMTRITRDKGALLHDDRIDALAIAVNYWTEQMAQSTVKALSASRDKAIDEEVRAFLEYAGVQAKDEMVWSPRT